MSEYDDLLDDEPAATEPASEQVPPVIKTPEDVPAALERVVKKAEPLYDRARVDREWLLRRAGKKK